MLKTSRASGTMQGGFTLVELLIAMLLTVILSSGIAVIVTQVFSVPNNNTARLSAIMQVNNAVDAISRDALQAKTLSVTTTGDLLYMTWTD